MTHKQKKTNFPILALLSGLAGEIRPTHLILSLSLQIKKKSMDKAKQEERMSKEFAAMEEAAMKAYQEDLKRMEREAAGSCCFFFTFYYNNA